MICGTKLQTLTLEMARTSRRRELNAVDFTEAHRENGRRGGVVAEPIGAICRFGAVDPNHEVPICQHLREENRLQGLLNAISI